MGYGIEQEARIVQNGCGKKDRIGYSPEERGATDETYNRPTLPVKVDAVWRGRLGLHLLRDLTDTGTTFWLRECFFIISMFHYGW